MIKTAEKKPVLEKIRQARLYAVTLPPGKGRDCAAMVRQALRGGADVIQLRDKNLPALEILDMARALKKICAERDALFVVNDRLDIALAAGAHGVHLGQDDLPVAEARRLVQGRDFLIGCSTHSLEQALKAETDGADYIGCGPIFATPTKPDYSAQGLELIRQYRAKIRIPFVAIGGIEASNLDQVIAAGALCVAMVRAIFGQEDIESAARSLKQKLV